MDDDVLATLKKLYTARVSLLVFWIDREVSGLMCFKLEEDPGRSPRACLFTPSWPHDQNSQLDVMAFAMRLQRQMSLHDLSYSEAISLQSAKSFRSANDCFVSISW